MARKQQKNVLEDIRARRLVLEAKITEIESGVLMLRKKMAALNDNEGVRHARRRLQYSKP